MSAMVTLIGGPFLRVLPLLNDRSPLAELGRVLFLRSKIPGAFFTPSAGVGVGVSAGSGGGGGSGEAAAASNNKVPEACPASSLAELLEIVAMCGFD